jgi:hypothetical protein
MCRALRSAIARPPVGDTVGVRQRPYVTNSRGATRASHSFLVLAAEWRRELDPRPVKL